jgi:hypothetical protein
MWDLTRWFVWEVNEEVVEEVGCDYRKHGEGMGSAGRERELEPLRIWGSPYQGVISSTTSKYHMNWMSISRVGYRKLGTQSIL